MAWNIGRFFAWIVVGLVYESLPKMAMGDLVGVGAFGPAAVVESFEGLQLGPNVGEYSVGVSGSLAPGIVEPYTFASGITLVLPVPNPVPGPGEDEIGTFLVTDFTLGNGSFGVGSRGVVDDPSDLPDGDAFMGIDGNGALGEVKFSLPADAFRVGVFVTAISDEIRMDVFDADMNLLESQSLAAVQVSEWPGNFLGIENANGIRNVVVFGDFVVLDGLRFEAVPEPRTAVLLMAGLAGLFVRRLRPRSGIPADQALGSLGIRPRTMSASPSPPPTSRSCHSPTGWTTDGNCAPFRTWTVQSSTRIGTRTDSTTGPSITLAQALGRSFGLAAVLRFSARKSFLSSTCRTPHFNRIR